MTVTSVGSANRNALTCTRTTEGKK